MGTLYEELQKWLKSPVKPKGQPKEDYSTKVNRPLWQEKIHQQIKENGGGQRAVKAVPSAKSTRLEAAQIASFSDNIKWDGNPDIVPYLTGQYAIDVATMASISVQSLAYRTGHSPFLSPTALRFSPEQAYIDLGRLTPWDQWKILWTRIGAHYFQDTLFAKEQLAYGEDE